MGQGLTMLVRRELVILALRLVRMILRLTSALVATQAVWPIPQEIQELQVPAMTMADQSDL